MTGYPASSIPLPIESDMVRARSTPMEDAGRAGVGAGMGMAPRPHVAPGASPLSIGRGIDEAGYPVMASARSCIFHGRASCTNHIARSEIPEGRLGGDRKHAWTRRAPLRWVSGNDFIKPHNIRHAGAPSYQRSASSIAPSSSTLSRKHAWTRRAPLRWVSGNDLAGRKGDAVGYWRSRIVHNGIRLRRRVQSRRLTVDRTVRLHDG
jgi:hypothetical protein